MIIYKDKSAFSGKMKPFWWVTELEGEKRASAFIAEGNPGNRVILMDKCAASIDAFERRIDAEMATPDDVFGPIV